MFYQKYLVFFSTVKHLCGIGGFNHMLVWVQLCHFLIFGLFAKSFSTAGNIVRRPSVPRYSTCPFAVLLQINVNFINQGHSSDLYKKPRCACSLFLQSTSFVRCPLFFLILIVIRVKILNSSIY